jgi:hypothetical protein
MNEVFFAISVAIIALVVGFLVGRWWGGNRRLYDIAAFVGPTGVVFEVIQEIWPKEYIVRPKNLRDGGPEGKKINDLFYFKLRRNDPWRDYGIGNLKVGHSYHWQQARGRSALTPVGRSIADEG